MRTRGLKEGVAYVWYGLNFALRTDTVVGACLTTGVNSQVPASHLRSRAQKKIERPKVVVN